MPLCFKIPENDKNDTNEYHENTDASTIYQENPAETDQGNATVRNYLEVENGVYQ